MSNKWFFRILMAVCLLLILSRGGFAAFVPLIRFIIIFGAIYFLFTLIKRGAQFSQLLKKMESFQKENRKNSADYTTIEICAKCGHEKGPRHRC
ncbi:MAG: hypothetical protein HQK54_07765 [Oligoflexales bacterium]|nr:hypothetical protein [Oligoflexales bacterium]